jgi:predicted ATP-grasp superfamily ATP-dependent carboligase
MTAAPTLLADNSTPAVLLGCFKHGGVGVVRSLGRLGVPVHCVDAQPTAPAFFSKYCRERLVWDLHRASEAEALRFLEALGRRIGRSVLIATSDIGAMFIADHADVLREWFLFPDADADLIRSLCSKREMYHVAHQHGVHTPETVFPESRADVLEYLESARFPVLLKPIYSYLPGRPPQPLLLVHTARELLEHYDANDDVANRNLMLQEFVPGGNDQTYTFNGYFDRTGRCALAFTGRKLRNFPGEFGQGSLGECRKVDEVETTTVRFMEEVGYRGCLDLGYRYDARDGQFKVNDINPRVGAMFRLFVGANGMDVVRAMYQDLTGQPVVPSATQEGRRWMVEDEDLLSAFRRFRRGDLTLREWGASLGGVEELSYVSWDDPRPVVPIARAHLGGAGRALRRAGARLAVG